MNLSYEPIIWTYHTNHIIWIISYEPIIWTYSYEPVQARFMKAVFEFDHDKNIMSNWGASEAFLVDPNRPWMISMETLPWLMGKYPLVSLWQSGKPDGQFSMACLMVHNLWVTVQGWSPNTMSYSLMSTTWCQQYDVTNMMSYNMMSPTWCQQHDVRNMMSTKWCHQMRCLQIDVYKQVTKSILSRSTNRISASCRNETRLQQSSAETWWDHRPQKRFDGFQMF